jgi:hypothetical protein
VRWRNSLSSLAFSIAITACLAKFAEQFDLLVFEQPDLLPIDGDDTDYFVISQHRHNSDRPGTAKLDQLNRGLSTFEISGSGSQVGNVNHPLAADCTGQCALRMRARDLIGSCCSKHGRGVVELSLAHEPFLDQIHRSELRPANAGRVLEHLVEHRGQIAGRRTDNLQHFGRCGLLLEGFFEISRLGLHLSEQPGVLDRNDGLVSEGLD